MICSGLLLGLMMASSMTPADPPGEVVLTNGRTLAALAYEVLADQVKVHQPDGFNVYLPVGRVDLAATERSLGPPGPPAKPSEMRTLWVQKQAPLPAKPKLGLVQNLEEWKRQHPQAGQGVFTAEPSSVQADSAALPKAPAAGAAGATARSEPPKTEPSGRGPGTSEFESKRQELRSRFQEMETNPDRFTEAERRQLEEEMRALDLELFETQDRAWEQRPRP